MSDALDPVLGGVSAIRVRRTKKMSVRTVLPWVTCEPWPEPTRSVRRAEISLGDASRLGASDEKKMSARARRRLGDAIEMARTDKKMSGAPQMAWVTAGP